MPGIFKVMTCTVAICLVLGSACAVAAPSDMEGASVEADKKGYLENDTLNTESQITKLQKDTLKSETVKGQIQNSSLINETEIKDADTDIEAKAKEILDEMTLEEKVGQMFLTGVTKSEVRKIVKKYSPGGVVLFKEYFDNETKKSVKKKLAKLQNLVDVDMITAVDEEGGTVVRVSAYKAFRDQPFESPREVFNSGGWKLVKKDAKEKARLLKKLGINTNLAPVADMAYNSSNYIYSRSFSSNAKKTSRFISTVVGEFENEGEVSTLKHFPGYGNNGNTHTDVEYDKRKLSEFENRDLLPFRAGIENNCPMIMVSHNIVYAFDKKYPASMSKKINKYIRQEMGFDGIIVTDSISMEAIKKWAKTEKKAVLRSVRAGNDLICTDNISGQYEILLKAVKDGDISEGRIDESVMRILKCKLEKGIVIQ